MLAERPAGGLLLVHRVGSASLLRFQVCPEQADDGRDSHMRKLALELRLPTLKPPALGRMHTARSSAVNRAGCSAA